MAELNPAVSPNGHMTSHLTIQEAGTDSSYTSVPPPYHNRVLPGGEADGGGVADSLNLILIVGLALVITVLARYLSTRGRRK